MQGKKKPVYDDGRTISDMNVRGMRGYRSEEEKKNRANANAMNLTGKEKWQLIKAAYARAFKMLLFVGLAFLLAGGIISLWLYLGSL